MAEIELIRNLEKISFIIPNRLLKLQGFQLKKNSKEFLEIIIYRGFSSSTTHQIEIDSEKQVIEFDHYFTKFILYEAPLIRGSEVIISCLLYTSPSPRDLSTSRMPSSA